MPQITGTFDARQFEPSQGGEAHPIGKFQAQISNTAIVPTKSNDGGMFRVEFTSPVGKIWGNYNLWNQNPKAVEIAQKELSALCHATGVFTLNWPTEGAELRGARCMIEVGHQIDKTTKEPNGYVEIKKVFDPNGNEPGKGQSMQQPQQAQPAPAPAPVAASPMQQNPNGGGWGQPAAAPNAGWSQGQQNPNPNAPPPWAK